MSSRVVTRSFSSLHAVRLGGTNSACTSRTRSSNTCKSCTRPSRPWTRCSARAGAVYLPERLHDVRIASKKLRYALELWERLRGERNTAPVRALKRVQALLGRMHDLQVLIERVREVQASLTPPSLSTWRELDELVVALDQHLQ